MSKCSGGPEAGNEDLDARFSSRKHPGKTGRELGKTGLGLRWVWGAILNDNSKIQKATSSVHKFLSMESVTFQKVRKYLYAFQG